MKWFILNDQQEISGPFPKEHIISNCGDDILVWGPGMDEWALKNDWKTHLNKPKIDNITPLTPKEDIEWYYANNNERFGPVSEDELIGLLNMLDFSSKTFLWHKSMKNWTALESCPEIFSKLDASQKKAA